MSRNYVFHPPLSLRRSVPKCLQLGLAALTSSLAISCASPVSLDPAQLEALKPLVAEVDQDRLLQTVQDLVQAHLDDVPMDCSQWDYTRESDCHLTRELARAYVMQTLEDLDYTVSYQQTEDGIFSTSNVVAELTGTLYPEEVLIIGAHFDAFYSGADDNSTGVAAMLELARIFRSNAFERTIRFVGFDLEEFGLVGSERYVKYDAFDDIIVGGIILDAVGYSDDTPGSQSGLPGFPLPETADFLGVIANADSRAHVLEVNALNQALSIVTLAAAVSPDNGDSPLTGDLLRSDHTPFWLRDKPVLFFTDTANFRNPNYHTETDTVDTLDLTFFFQVTQLATASIAYWAGGPLQ